MVSGRALSAVIVPEVVMAQGQLITTWQDARLWGAAACLKAHEFIIAETIEYTRNRKAFGGSILDNQTVHFKLAEMQTEVELLRSLIYRANYPAMNALIAYLMENCCAGVDCQTGAGCEKKLARMW